MLLLDVALLMLAAVFAVATSRLAAGPTDADRVLGLDLTFAVLISALALLALRLGQPLLLDLVLIATLLGFLTTVAVARMVSGEQP